ncbi:hypothetical protein ScPMuIL_011880 [Solemya velum]
MGGLYVRIVKIARKQAKVMAAENATSTEGTVHTVNDKKSFFMVTMLLGWFTLSYIPMCVYLLTTLLCATCTVNKYIRE